MPNSATPSPGGTDGVSPEAVTDAVAAEVDELHRTGVARAQAVDSLHTVANDLIQHLITPTPGPAQRNALTCADALRTAATVLADHDDAPTGWAPTELQHHHPAPTSGRVPRRRHHAAGAFHRHTALTRAAVPTRSRRVEIRARTPHPATPRPHLATGQPSREPTPGAHP